MAALAAAADEVLVLLAALRVAPMLGMAAGLRADEAETLEVEEERPGRPELEPTEGSITDGVDLEGLEGPEVRPVRVVLRLLNDRLLRGGKGSMSLHCQRTKAAKETAVRNTVPRHALSSSI